MPEFLRLQPPDLALQEMLKLLSPLKAAEFVDTSHALGRVTAGPILAPYALPTFTVDGYAVRAKDTFGASEALPAYLTCRHEIPMGAKASVSLEPGECALIHTGGMLPEGADAVVMVEYTQNAHQEEIEILRAAAPGENVLMIGEDVAEGEQVIAAGVRLRPAEIGGLSADRLSL
jgi:molybdopterin molybdotransferase